MIGTPSNVHSSNFIQTIGIFKVSDSMLGRNCNGRNCLFTHFGTLKFEFHFRNTMKTRSEPGTI